MRDDPPRIRKHIDGPILVMRNGGHKWISLSDRVRLFFGLWTLEDLEMKYWECPDYWSGAAF